MKTKFLMFAMSMVLVVGMLAGCGSGISDASALTKANKEAQDKVESVHIDCAMDINMTMTMDGMEEVLGTSDFTLPMKMDMAIDSGKETAHADADASLSFLGQSETSKVDMYVDSKNGVTYTGTDGVWTKQESESSVTDMMNSLNGIDEEVLKNAEFQEKDDTYVMTLDAKVLGDSMKDMNVLSTMNMDELSFEEFNLEKGSMTYVFDKSTVLLKQIEMKDITINAKGKVEGSEYGLKMTMTGTFDFSKYNELDAKDYEIPQDVIDSATKSL